MGRLAIGFVVGFLVIAAGLSEAHNPGAPPAGAQGSFLLTPPGTNNSTLHNYITDFGLPATPNDRFQFTWAVDGGEGPPVDFELHSHGGVQGYVRYYNTTASRDNDTFVIPQGQPVMLSFYNTWNFTLNVTYSFVVFAPPQDPVPYIVFMGVGTAGAILWMRWIARGSRAGGGDAEEEPEGADALSDPPTRGRRGREADSEE